MKIEKVNCGEWVASGRGPLRYIVCEASQYREAWDGYLEMVDSQVQEMSKNRDQS